MESIHSCVYFTNQSAGKILHDICGNHMMCYFDKTCLSMLIRCTWANHEKICEICITLLTLNLVGTSLGGNRSWYIIALCRLATAGQEGSHGPVQKAVWRAGMFRVRLSVFPSVMSSAHHQHHWRAIKSLRMYVTDASLHMSFCLDNGCRLCHRSSSPCQSVQSNLPATCPA